MNKKRYLFLIPLLTSIAYYANGAGGFGPCKNGAPVTGSNCKSYQEQQHDAPPCATSSGVVCTNITSVACNGKSPSVIEVKVEKDMFCNNDGGGGCCHEKQDQLCKTTTSAGECTEASVEVYCEGQKKNVTKKSCQRDTNTTQTTETGAQSAESFACPKGN